MARWRPFCALGYFERQVETRSHRPDGQPVHHRLRRWSERVHVEVLRVRGARRQPLWPRVMGWGLLSMALLAAVGGEYPMPTPPHVAVSATIKPTLVPIAASPAGAIAEGVPTELAWNGALAPPYTFVLLDADYGEVLRVPTGVARVLPANVPALGTALGGGGVFHWFVVAGGPDGAHRSLLQTLEIR